MLIHKEASIVLNLCCVSGMTTSTSGGLDHTSTLAYYTGHGTTDSAFKFSSHHFGYEIGEPNNQTTNRNQLIQILLKSILLMMVKQKQLLFSLIIMIQQQKLNQLHKVNLKIQTMVFKDNTLLTQMI